MTHDYDSTHCEECYRARVHDFGVLVLDKGLVRLESHNVSDEMVIRSAKVSFATDDLTGVDFDRFIGFLMKNRHGTPFEHGSMTFQVKAPIVVAREWMRSRMASYNEMSGRYTVIPGEWYVPAVEDIRTQVGKPGSYVFEPFEDKAEAQVVRENINLACETAFAHYGEMLHAGVAKEQARLVLPQNMYSMFYWTVNPRSLMHFLSLRSAPDAMLEIRRYAEAVEEIFDYLMPVTAKAFRENGRVSP